MVGFACSAGGSNRPDKVKNNMQLMVHIIGTNPLTILARFREFLAFLQPWSIAFVRERQPTLLRRNDKIILFKRLENLPAVPLFFWHRATKYKTLNLLLSDLLDLSSAKARM